MKRAASLILAGFACAVFAISAHAAETKTLAWKCSNCVAEGVTGYKVYYGSTSYIEVDAPTGETPEAPYDQVIEINDPNQMSYTLTLPVGVWHFRVTAVHPTGETDFTYEVSLKIKPSSPTGLKANDPDPADTP